MKILLITLLAWLFNFKAFSQLTVTGGLKATSEPSFYLYYFEAGMGSNMDMFMPVIRINNGTLVYTFERTTLLFEKNDRIDTILITPVQKSSIDSIIGYIKHLGDTSIHKFNPCIMSGSYHHLTISSGADTLKYSLGNTFDRTALKVINILENYIPNGKKLFVDEEMIIKEESCWEKMRKRWSENSRKKNPG